MNRLPLFALFFSLIFSACAGSQWVRIPGGAGRNDLILRVRTPSSNPANELMNPEPPPGSRPEGPLIAYVPAPRGGPRLADPARMCAVIRKHSAEFARYWETERGGETARSRPMPVEAFEPVCLAIPLETRRCLYEGYRVDNLAVCNALLHRGGEATRALVDELFLEPRGETTAGL